MRMIQAVKMWLAKKGLIVLAELVDKERKLYRVYCPKCGTWHTAYLSGYPGEEHFHRRLEAAKARDQEAHKYTNLEQKRREDEEHT